jgi:pimeloyl-ACP methyl ester carboxylesterase
LQSLTVDLDGPVHVADFGGAGPTMVLVHGLGGSCLNWLGAGPRLARRARVLALDMAGFGRTALGLRSGRIAANRNLLDRFLRAVVGGPALLVGNSMGGLIAMMQAAACPETVTGLVLAAPAQPHPRGVRIDRQVLAAFALYSVPGLATWYIERRAARLGPDGLVRETLRLCCADPARVSADVQAAHVELARDRLAGMPWANRAFLDAARSTLRVLRRRREYRAMVDRIAAPTLVIQGDCDRLVSPAASRELARRRPDWTLEALEDIGHVPQLENPALFVERVERWLDGPGRAALVAATRAASRDGASVG